MKGLEIIFWTKACFLNEWSVVVYLRLEKKTMGQTIGQQRWKQRELLGGRCDDSGESLFGSGKWL